MSNGYWRCVEPIWDSVSIYDGGEIFLRGFGEVSEKQRVLFAAHWAQSEIMNGGLGQFFTNDTGVLAPEAVEAFQALGMPKCALLLSEAMTFFGERYPRERLVRQDAFERFHEEFGADGIPLREYEDAMATEIEEENGGFWVAADKYANQD
jgi:hypothetical protein